MNKEIQIASIEIENGSAAVDSSRDAKSEVVNWSVGDRCLALYSEDGVEYPAAVRAVKV